MAVEVIMVATAVAGMEAAAGGMAAATMAVVRITAVAATMDRPCRAFVAIRSPATDREG